MKILISNDSDRLTRISEYLAFNRIDYQHHDFFNPELDFGRYVLPDHEHCLVIITPNIMRDLLDWPQGQQNVRNFCRQQNQIWIMQDHDVAFDLIYYKTIQGLAETDPDLEPGSIQIFSESPFSDHSISRAFKNIRIRVCPNWFIGNMPRISRGQWQKKPGAQDFMVTMIKRQRAPHRSMLYRQLMSNPHLASRGLISFRSRKKQGWIGETPHQHGWFDGYPSMDLYQNALIELVPETMYHGAYYATEKINKPMATRTPFMVVSTAGFLSWMKNQGFQTFDSLIDESYDDQHRIQDRVARMLMTLDHIVQQGAWSFYHSSQPILQHNYQRLCELTGSYYHVYDREISCALDEFGQIDQ